MNSRTVIACALFLPCLAFAQSDFSLSTTTPLSPKIEDAPLSLPPLLGDTAIRAEMDQARPKSPKVEEVLREVVNDLKMHQYAAALPKLEFLQGMRPSEPDILILRGCIYAESGYPEVAERIFNKAIQVAPTHPWARLNLAEAQVNQKKYLDAEKTLFILSTARPESEVVRFKLVTVLAIQKKFESAERELQSLRENASTPAYYFASAAVAFAQGNAAKGRSIMDQGKKLYTDTQTNYFQNILVSMGWIEESP